MSQPRLQLTAVGARSCWGDIAEEDLEATGSSAFAECGHEDEGQGSEPSDLVDLSDGSPREDFRDLSPTPWDRASPWDAAYDAALAWGTSCASERAIETHWPAAALHGHHWSVSLEAPSICDAGSERDSEASTAASSITTSKNGVPVYLPEGVPPWANQLLDQEQRVTDSSAHAQGLCKPCTFFHGKGCKAGPDCQFCHLCTPGEFRRRKKLIKGWRAERDALLGLRAGPHARRAACRSARRAGFSGVDGF